VTTDPNSSLFGTIFATPAGRRSFSIVVAALPCLSFAFLFIVNPRYMSNFFVAEIRPLGLAIFGVVLLLSVFSYILIRPCAVMIASGKRVLGLVLATGVMAFVAFPAVLLVALGPAALILLRANL
jgi:hypothetical protein